MFELDSDDRLAIATLQSARETSVPTRLLREAAILVPCAVIFYFAVAWGDGAALWIGPGLYAGYRIYLSFVDLARDRRLGEIIRAYEDGLVGSACAAPGTLLSAGEGRGPEPARHSSPAHGPSPAHRHTSECGHDHDHDHGPSHSLWAGEPGEGEEDSVGERVPMKGRELHLEPEEAIAECFASASEETALASEHYRLAAKRFRAGKVPRGCAHAFAAFGHLQDARRAARAAASIHADHAEPGR